MKTLAATNPTFKLMNLMMITLTLILTIIISNHTYGNNIPGRYNLPDHLRPAFENMPVWRLQLRVKTGNRKHANTEKLLLNFLLGKRVTIRCKKSS